MLAEVGGGLSGEPVHGPHRTGADEGEPGTCRDLPLMMNDPHSMIEGIIVACYPMDVRLEGKVALVTGASRGIGRAIAEGMAASGAAVMLSSRKVEDLETAAEEIRAATGADVDVFAANAGEPDQADACVAATVERFHFFNEVLAWHAHGEELAIFPALEGVAPDVAEAYEMDHRGLDTAFDALSNAVTARDAIQTARARPSTS